MYCVAQNVYIVITMYGYPLMVEPEKHWYRKEDLLGGQNDFLVMDLESSL